MPGIGIGNRIGGSAGRNWKQFWATLISVTVENAAPTHIVLTFPVAKTSLGASDFTIAGFPINSASWTGAELTLVVSQSIIYSDSLTITFIRTGETASITNNLAVPSTSPLARWYFDAGSGNEVTDESENNYDILIQQDSTTPQWGNRRLIFTPTTHLLSPVIPINTAGSFTLMFSSAAIGRDNGGSIISIGTRDNDWRFASYRGGRDLFVNGNTQSLANYLPHTTMSVAFIIQDGTANTTKLYCPDTGKEVTYSGKIGIATNVQLGFGITPRIALYDATKGCEISSAAVWSRVLSPEEIIAEYNHEKWRLGNDSFVREVNDIFDRADTALGTIGTSTSGWRWDYRNTLSWTTPDKGRVYNNQWVCENARDLGYAAVILSANAIQMGGTFSFTGTEGEDSTFTIANAITDNWIQSMIHIDIAPFQLVITVWQAGSKLATILYQSLGIARDGKEHIIACVISGDTLSVTIDANTYTVTDARISPRNGRYVYFEQSNGTTSFVQVNRMWAK